MSLPRYAEYKDSGVEWLGEVPAHWRVYPLKRELDFLTSGSRGWAEHYADDGALFIRIGNLTRDSIHLDLTDIQRVAVPDGAEGERTKVQPGDILFSITAYLGSVAVAPDGLEPAFVSQHVALARLRKGNMLPAWTAYVALSWVGKTYLETQGYGGTKVQLSLDDVANLLLTVPPLHEQIAIAAFLDRETAKIDALMAEQDKLLTLLAEKRQATISQAVTTGLDPDVPMKDSGVEWLGEVPAHWKISRLKFVASVQTGVAKGKDYTGKNTTEVAYLRVANVQDGYLALDDIATIVIPIEDLARYRLQPGDVLMNEGGDFDKLGRGHVWNGEIENCIHQNHVFAVRPRQVSSAWVNKITSSDYAQFYFMTRSKQSTNLASISSTNVMELPLLLPPEAEQEAILMFVDAETARLDALAAEAARAIALLKERRSALISAAVTGKIDVRNALQQQEACHA